ncbi:peptide/nickel transport system permease protein [Microbacterium terrae]|uniref:Nickel transport system permease protein NikB n=1 Tax=Microbacterium terrae TaxID=69369 RepID=A0A0M2GVK1_9MICO|nr:ABC transporter permease [Microbacterium terrae]KJL37547.1 Nickel transport system permease protein NikB [Microbacterium terrae]MBP1076377.1 peptide/nickel transport system permease protein [Microbacterium terrae]GLJ97201.1 ABC transporter permease [Microbacterium terrae]
MIGYILRRVGTTLILVLVVTFITFLLLSTSFESVAQRLLGDSANPETTAAMMAELGLDRPVPVQYGEWLVTAVQGDFGNSIYNGLDVGTTVFQRLAVTLSLIIPALVITALISVSLGVWAASRGGFPDRFAQGVSLVGYIVPGLLLAIVLVLVFAVNLKWLPATGYVPITTNVVGWARSITLPIIVLVVASVASLTSQVRGTMIDELRKDYVRTLRTRGVSTGRIIYKHALRNAAGPALTVLSLEFVAMFGAALIIENVFGLPGIGSFSFDAALQADIPMLLGLTVVSVLMVATVNLVTDLVNTWLNPKVKLS